MALRLGWMNAEIASKKYFAAIDEGSLLTATSWRIFANSITDIGSGKFRYVQDHQKE